MFRNLFHRKESEELKKLRQKWLEECLEKIPRLKKLINSKNSGWPEFVEILEDYKTHLEKRKAFTSLDTADDATIEQLKKYDHEKYILNFIINSVGRYIDKIEKMALDAKKEEALRARKKALDGR